MKYIIYIPFLVWILLIQGCRKDAMDAFYGKPQDAAGSIREVLSQRGNFTQYLLLADRFGHQRIIDGQGYWTIFAPNDAAFTSYLSKQGYSTIDDIPDNLARSIVAYSLVYNSYKKARLEDYQANAGWVLGEAFRRRTSYYDFVYTELVNGKTLHVLDANRNVGYNIDGNNNKYLTYFSQAYFTRNNLTAFDYQYFYPGTTFTGFQLLGADVIHADILAENAVIHEVNQVSEPPLSLDGFLASKPEYSLFKEILDRYFVSYTYNEEATKRYQAVGGETDGVYIKRYSAALSFSPNNENYLKQQDNDGQRAAYTLFVPTNAALQEYFNNTILEHYPGKDIHQLPLSIITDVINAHFWQNPVWPSKFETTANERGEPARFDVNTDITDKAILSNGFFYGTRKVQQSNIFHSVYGQAYLNPNYSLFTKALDLELKANLLIPQLRYLVFYIPDNELQRAGYLWNVANNTFQYTAEGGSSVIGGDAVSRIRRLVATHVVDITGRPEIDLSGKGILETVGGEYIVYDNYTAYSAGSLENANSTLRRLPITERREGVNGRSYQTSGVLLFTERTVGKHLETLTIDATNPYSLLYQYLKNAKIYNESNGNIEGVNPGIFYTVLAPNNEAIRNAVRDGWLPGTVNGSTVTPNVDPGSELDQDRVVRFIQYHILHGSTVVTDGRKEGAFATLLKNELGQVQTVRITNTNAAIRVADAFNVVPQANSILELSNVLSNRTVIHLLDNYLKYNY